MPSAPSVMLPEVCSTVAPLGLTLEGQHITKAVDPTPTLAVAAGGLSTDRR